MRLFRVGAEEVTFIVAASVDDLALMLRERERPDPVGAYAIFFERGRRQRVFVFSGEAFASLWKQVAEEGFSPAAVSRLFLSGEDATAVLPGRFPARVAYVPETGDVWLSVASRDSYQQAPADLLYLEEVAEDRSFAVGGGPVEEEVPGPIARTPHLEVEGGPILRPEERFAIEVYCDRLPSQEGEEAVALNLDLPPGWTEAELAVWLALPPELEVAHPVGSVVLSQGSEESTVARFEGVVRSDAREGPLQVTAVFGYGGRPCGQVTRRLGIGSGSVDPGEERRGPPRIVVHPASASADLTIEVKATGDDEQEFECRVSTPLLPDRTASPTRWRLSSRAPDLVAALMGGFTEEGLSDGERISRLRGSGMQLWKAVPEEVRSVFWELVDAGTPPNSIFVVTDEWSFPWELIVPVRGMGPDRELREPWGVEFSVGRWVSAEMLSPPQRVEVLDSYVFAPTYPPELSLPDAAEEADYVCQRLNGTAIEPGDFEPLEQALGTAAVSLLHFACHGEVNAEQVQALRFQDGNFLRYEQIPAMEKLSQAIEDKRPLVFLNACEAGRSVPALVGSGGFASVFIEVGATCVIAPMWSVDDKIAHALAIQLYDQLRASPLPAEAMRELRARAYESGGADSWTAYSFYGDPLTRVEIVPP